MGSDQSRKNQSLYGTSYGPYSGYSSQSVYSHCGQVTAYFLNDICQLWINLELNLANGKRSNSSASTAMQNSSACTTSISS